MVEQQGVDEAVAEADLLQQVRPHRLVQEFRRVLGQTAALDQQAAQDEVLGAQQSAKALEKIQNSISADDEDETVIDKVGKTKVMASCPQCNAPLAANAKFCPECGAKLLEKKFCAECGAALTPGVKFCPECGTKAF